MIKLSETSKLDGIKSWSLEALETCPGAWKGGKRVNGGNKKDEMVDACKGCYALGGNYRFPHVKKKRAESKEDWKRKEWIDDMVLALQDSRYFRWFDSGDMYDINLARKIFEVMALTPWCRHWLPTRMEKFEKFGTVIRAMRALPNVMVRFSSDSVQGEFTPGLHGSTIIRNKNEAPAGVKVCLAYENEKHNCNGCRACWDKGIPVIAYVAHGLMMKGVLKRLTTA